MDNTNDISVDQLGNLLYIWGLDYGMNLQIGYLEAEKSPRLLLHPDDRDVKVGWLYNDGAWTWLIRYFLGNFLNHIPFFSQFP